MVGLERRTLPGETAADVEAEIEALLEACRRRTASSRLAAHAARPRALRDRRRRTDSSALAREAATERLGAPPAVAGASYWADAAFIAAAGIPTILFGPSGEGAHAAEEWVSVVRHGRGDRCLVAVAEQMCS